jgi:predicted RNA methylase
MAPHLRLRRVVQTIADIEQRPWSELRILDLGSLEGLFALEFASHGAQVVGIEGRETNNAIARAAARSRNLSNVEFITEDVRKLSVASYGRFDVVLCSGILYHLPANDGCEFIQSIADICKHLTIIDTHVALLDGRPALSYHWRGHTYRGTGFSEHSPEDDVTTKLSRSWSSLDNPTSFWITKPSLLNLLRDVGFTTVSEVLRPQSFQDFSDRLTFAAIKGELQHFQLSPELETTTEPDWAEVSDLRPFPTNTPAPPEPQWKKLVCRL